ncbi:MAG: hypothetical protein ACXVGN_08675 [Mycobacteriaceae bacterium]
MTDSTHAAPLDAAAPPLSTRSRRRARRVVIAVAAGGLVLAGTGAAYATTVGAPTPSADSANGSGNAARPAHQPHLGGTVASVSPGAVTVTDRDGFTRTIRTSPTTTYGSGLTADLAVGTHIHAVGTLDADHTSLDATTISKAPTGDGAMHEGNGAKQEGNGAMHEGRGAMHGGAHGTNANPGTPPAAGSGSAAPNSGS